MPRLKRVNIPKDALLRLYMEPQNYEEIQGSLRNLGHPCSIATIRRRLHDYGFYMNRSERWAYYIKMGKWDANLVHLQPGEDHPNYKHGKYVKAQYPITRNCEFCMIEFSVTERNPDQRFCGMSCSNVRKRTSLRVKKQCLECNKVFMTTQDKREKMYCSSSCQRVKLKRANRERNRKLFVSRVLALHNQGYSRREIPKELIRRHHCYRRGKQPMSKTAISRIIRENT